MKTIKVTKMWYSQNGGLSLCHNAAGSYRYIITAWGVPELVYTSTWNLGIKYSGILEQVIQLVAA